MSATAIAALGSRSRTLLPGFLVSAMVGIAATFLAEHYGAPVMLFALLLGMALNFLHGESVCKAGIEFTARELLRLGVAVLGIRITFGQIAALGWHPVVMVVALVTLTILVSVAAARLLGFNSLFGLLTGGATAICGGSAALALAAALPAHPKKDKALLFTVLGVSALSNTAMILYPTIAHLLGLSPQPAGIFLGGTIHEVAQAVGAGYSMGHETGDVATVIKLMRVAMLLPVILVAVMITRARGVEPGAKRPPLLPWFAVGFVLLAALNSTGHVPELVQQTGGKLSQWCFVIAIAALGMKAQLRELTSVGIKPILLMVGEAAFLAVLVLGMLRWGA